jgi:hypothetical protein
VPSYKQMTLALVPDAWCGRSRVATSTKLSSDEIWYSVVLPPGYQYGAITAPNAWKRAYPKALELYWASVLETL